jgi:hypothetical protein
LVYHIFNLIHTTAQLRAPSALSEAVCL